MLQLISMALIYALTVWCIGWVCIGSSIYRSFYFNLAKQLSIFRDDTKTGAILITITMPILLIATIAALSSKQPHTHTHTHNRVTDMNAKKKKEKEKPWWILLLLPPWLLDTLHYYRLNKGTRCFDRFSFFFLLIPLLINYATAIHRHFTTNHHITLDLAISKASNSAGMVAIIAMSWFLIPVTRHGSILRFLQWNPASAVRIHIWSGWIIVLAAILHGAMHISRWWWWWNLSSQNDDTDQHSQSFSIISYLIPPRQCWSLPIPSSSSTTSSPPSTFNCSTDQDCNSCYTYWRNLTGFLAGLCLCIIGLSSLNYVRRKHYQVFYLTHISAAPLMIFFLLLHYRRAFLYLAPSLLYYVASTAVMREETDTKMKKKYGVQKEHNQQQQQHNSTTPGIKIVTAHHLPSAAAATATTTTAEAPNERCCFALTFQCASVDEANKYSAGQYARLSVLLPSSLSSSSCTNKQRSLVGCQHHPFTINRVLDKPDQLRIIFRVVGDFTARLGACLQQEIMCSMDTNHGTTTTTTTGLPPMQLEGFFGSQLRVDEMLQHDKVVIVAGGIGITPYLSVLDEIVSSLSLLHPPPSSQPKFRNTTNKPTPPNEREIVLHWIVRETALLDYVEEQYFRPMLEKAHGSEHMRIRVVVHQTSGRPPKNHAIQTRNNDNHNHNDSPNHDIVGRQFDSGSTWEASRFSIGLSTLTHGNFFGILSYLVVCWLGLCCVLLVYHKNPAKTDMAYRLWYPVIFVIFIWAAAKILNVCLRWFPPLPFSTTEPSHDLKGPTRKNSDIEEAETEKDTFPDESTALCCGNHGPTIRSIMAYERNRVAKRPAVQELLRCLEDAHLPAIFSCGPNQLMRDLRNAANNSCRSRRQRGAADVALYQEYFEL